MESLMSHCILLFFFLCFQQFIILFDCLRFGLPMSSFMFVPPGFLVFLISVTTLI